MTDLVYREQGKTDWTVQHHGTVRERIEARLQVGFVIDEDASIVHIHPEERRLRAR